jgi:TolB-like protein
MLGSMSQRLRTNALAAASCVLVACAGTPTVYTHPSSNVADMRTIAVLPFDNMANSDRGAADRIHQLMLAEMQADGAFAVVEPGLVAQAVRSRSGALSALPPEDLKEIGQSLHADGVLIGTILSYTDFRGQDGGEATIQLRLVETRSGGTIWTASHSRKGTTFTKRLFGLASDSGAEVARAVIRSELATIPR